MDWFGWFKAGLGVMSAALLGLASQIEPSAAVWASGAAGSLFSVAIGPDRTIQTMTLHAALGLFVAVFGSQMTTWFTHMPQPAAGFGLGLFGVMITLAIARKIETEGIGWLIPRLSDRGKTP